MLDGIAQFLALKGYLPHGYCISWSPPLVWTFFVSDLLTFLAYFSMPAALIYFSRRRKDFPYRWLLWMFAAFILACGATHLMDVLVLWQPLYGLHAALKAATALVSLVTAVVLWKMIPRALELPSPTELREANAKLQREIAERKRFERALRLLTDCNKLLARASDEQRLLADTCRLVVDTGGYRMAWVGFAEDDREKSVRPVAHAGGEGFVAGIVKSWADTESGRGPTGAAIRTGAAQLIRDIATDPRMRPWREAALAHGGRSCVALPLVAADGALGALSIYAAEADAFGPEEQRLLEELANNLAYGIGTLRARALRAAAEEALDAHRNKLEELVAQRTAELAAAKQEAERANNAKSRFLAAASHDLRQPLSALSLYVDVLASQSGAGGAPLVAPMKECVGSLNAMLSDLLDLSKLDAGVVTPTVSDFALDALLDKVIAAHAPEAALKALSLRHRPSGRIARTDFLLYQRIVGNLVSNAVRYTERGGVLVGWRRRQGRWWVEVWDTGVGVPADKTGEIFEEFKQLGNPARNRALGTGLGLAIVAKAAALLGLQVQVRSRVGKGSVFAIELPPGEALRPAVPGNYAHRPLRIALIDDNATVAGAVAYALTAVGHQVVAAASRPELVALLEPAAPPDLVISDYRLGGEEDGCDVIARLRSVFGADLPAILITGDTDPQVIRRMAEQGVVVQHKPLDLETLRARIGELTA